MSIPPFPLEDPVLQRLFEDAYQKIASGERSREEMLADLNAQMADMRDRIAYATKEISEPAGGTVLPIPQNLSTVKIGFFGLASVDSFKLASYPGLAGYEFYADDTTGFAPNNDRLSDDFNLVHQGPMPWCIYWCGLGDNAYYVRARTYGKGGSVSSFADEASTDDKPDTPENVTAVQHGDLYPRMGQYRADVIVSWDELDDPYIIGYDVTIVDEGGI